MTKEQPKDWADKMAEYLTHKWMTDEKVKYAKMDLDIAQLLRNVEEKRMRLDVSLIICVSNEPCENCEKIKNEILSARLGDGG